jgi:hypothetical protein
MRFFGIGGCPIEEILQESPNFLDVKKGSGNPALAGT